MTKKWEDKFFTIEEIAEITNAFTEEYSEHLKDDENFEVEGSYEKDSLILTVILKNNDKSFYYPVNIKALHKENKDLDKTQAKEIAIDFISSYFNEYFLTEKDTFIPIEWAPYKFMDLNLQAKAQIINKKLEEEANKLLLESEIKN